MASAIFTPPCRSQPSLSSLPKIAVKAPAISKLTYPSQISYSKTPNPSSFTCVPQLNLSSFSRWNGPRRNGFSILQQSFRLGRRRKCKGKVFASLFGVGAPEALVIGVVALLVFGPKGLAEVARNLGKTLRAFQPTIRELQEVSREFKSTLEKEIGLDELKNPIQGNYTADTLNQPSRTPPVANPENSLETSSSPADTSEESQETAPVNAVTAENSQTTTPAANSEDAQPTFDQPNGSASQSKAYSSEDLLKITEEQLNALKQKEQTTDISPAPSQDDVQDIAAGTPSTETPKTEN